MNNETLYAHNLAEKAWNHKDQEVKKLQRRIDKLEKELKKSNDFVRCNSQYKMKWGK